MNDLSKHFSRSEFERDLGKLLTQEEINKAYLFCVILLDKVRDRFGVIKITNFKRDKDDTQRLLEAGYKPSPTSQHKFCEGVDFVTLNANLNEVYRCISEEWKWPGQLELDLDQKHIHAGLPRFGVAPNHFIKTGVV